MNGEKFDCLVKVRAKQRVEDKIDIFIRKVTTALFDLYKESRYCSSIFTDAKSMGLINNLLLERKNRVCPEWLLKEEEDKVEKELLDIMDEMQKALISVEKYRPDINFEGSTVIYGAATKKDPQTEDLPF
jgi:hypothetical protein